MNIEINNNMNVNTDEQNINLDYDNDSSQMSMEDGKPSITIPQTTMTVESGVGSVSTGGTTDHAKLQNLDYEHSGHTGFQKAGNYVEDEAYVHTDNNFTDEDKEKLDGLENFSGKAQDVSYEDNYGYGGKNVQDALDKAFAQIDNGFGADAIGYKDNLGYDANNVQDALDTAFDALDGKMTYKDFTEQVGIISDLETENASNVVNAINDVNSKLNDLPTIVPFIPQTRISQLVMNGVKYLKIEWNNNPSFLQYQKLKQASLYLYKYTKTGRKQWVRDQRETTHTGVKKWVHPANGFTLNINHQCWGIKSFDANPVFAENYSVDDIVSEAEYPIANDGYVRTEYPLIYGQTSVLIPLNDIVSPILKVAHIGPEALVLPREGDGLELKLMGVKQNKNKGRCNQPIKFCLVVGAGSNLYIGSCLNVATIQLFKYRVTHDNDMHGYDTRYSVLPDVGYSVYIK